MYHNLAYLGKASEDIVDKSKPIIVTAAGYYRVHDGPDIRTDRMNGRGDYQLLYIASGRAQFLMDHQDRMISKGNMVLFRPGEKQSYRFYVADKPEIYWVHFTGSDVEKLLDRYQIAHDDTVFFAGNYPDYPWLFRKMIQELQLMRIGYDDLLIIHLQQIFLMINRYQQESLSLDSEMIDVVEKAIHYFHENYNQSISIQKYAEEHNFTPSWFIQNFKCVTKMTPLQYIVSLRISNAMNLMDNTNYNINHIAGMVGYDNALYFSRLFKKHTGMSPSDYKERNI